MEVIPHSMEEVGLWAIPLALLGLLVPSMIEKRYHKMAPQCPSLGDLVWSLRHPDPLDSGWRRTVSG